MTYPLQPLDWMVKEALYLPSDTSTPALQLDTSEGSVGHSKLASLGLLPEVQRFIDTLQPREGCRYVLVNAMGASEYYGMNANRDAFPEHGLVNIPPGWRNEAEPDKKIAQNVSYGFPTFYRAGCFVHHRNKDHAKRVGDVAFVTWNDRMKRVELVMEIERERSMNHGGSGFWASMDRGELPAVSMGARVKFDRCSKCTDLDTFYKALKKFDPKRHANPGMAVLEEHIRLRDAAGIPREAKDRVGGIRGIGRTRKEYCDCMLHHAGEIDPISGLQIFVYNDFPLFFDISLVFIPADRTAQGIRFIDKNTTVKTGSQHFFDLRPARGEIKIAGLQELLAKANFEGPTHALQDYLKGGLGGSTVQEAMLRHDLRPGTTAGRDSWAPEERRPSLSPPRSDEITTTRDSGNVKPEDNEFTRKLAAERIHLKQARMAKRSEMDKRVETETTPEVIRDEAKGEADLPKDLLNMLGKLPLGAALGTAGAMGIVLRPREFQRVSLVSMGLPDLADRCDDRDMCFGYRSARGGCPALTFANMIAQALAPMLSQRSGFSPFLRERVILQMPMHHEKKASRPSSLPGELFFSLGASYQAYREELLSKLAGSQAKLAASSHPELRKVAEMSPEELFTPLSFRYFTLAFQDEVAARPS